MSITTDVLIAKKNINNYESMIEHYEDTIPYSIEKYQKEYFYFMQKMYMFRQMERKTFEILDGIIVEFKNISKVPKFTYDSELNLYNFELHFYIDGKLLMMITIDPHSDLTKEVENGRVKNILGVDCINVQRFTTDETSFISAVNAFKYIMENPDKFLAEVEEVERKEYLSIMSNHYYRDLTFLNEIEDMKKMVRVYMETPSIYKPIITKEIEAPDYSKMTLIELMCEFDKKVSSDEIAERLDEFCDETVSYFPNIESQSKEIENFFISATGNERYISDAHDLIDKEKETQIVENNGFSYKFHIYGCSSSQMLIDVIKDENRIGSLYYWNRNSYRKKLSLYVENIGCRRKDYRGLNGKTIPDFLDALNNLSKNWKDIVTPVLNNYMKVFNDLLTEYTTKEKEMYKKQEEAKNKFYKKQEEMEKYF